MTHAMEIFGQLDERNYELVDQDGNMGVLYISAPAARRPENFCIALESVG
jgi:hypothetical protein